MKNTAPSVVLTPVASVQALKSMPIELRAPGTVAGPSMPMVRNESNSASAIMGKKAGLVGPVQRLAWGIVL
jgi:hypothetical protein